MRRKNIRETLNTHVSIDKQIKRQSVCLSVAFSFFMFASFWFLLICRELELVLMTMPDAGCWCWSAFSVCGVFNFDKFISNSLSQQATCKHVLKAAMQRHNVSQQSPGHACLTVLRSHFFSVNR